VFEVCEGEKRVGRRVERVGKHDGMVVVVVGEVVMGVWGGLQDWWRSFWEDGVG
jgi:hypothetical protein